MIDDITASIARAMKARDQVTLAALRMLKTALTNKEIERGHRLDAQESLQVVQSVVKQRRESIEQFEKGGRMDLVARERAELAVLEALLPPPVDPADLERLVAEAVTECGATSVKDMGKAMKAAMAKVAGRGVDGKLVNELVRKRLSG